MRRTLLVKSGSPPCTITTKGGQQRCSGWDTCSWVNSAVRRKRNFNLSFPIFESFHFKWRTKERKNKTKQTQQNFTLKRVAKWWEPSFVEECVCGLWVIYRNDAFSTAFSRTTKQPCYNSLQVSCMSSFAEVHPSVQKTKNTWYHWAPTLQIYIYIYTTLWSLLERSCSGIPGDSLFIWARCLFSLKKNRRTAPLRRGPPVLYSNFPISFSFCSFSLSSIHSWFTGVSFYILDYIIYLTFPSSIS